MLLAAIVSVALVSQQQEIPKGVHYKKAPDAVNKPAAAKLQKFFASDPKTVDLSHLGAQALVVGPGMWQYFGSICRGMVQARRARIFGIGNERYVQIYENKGELDENAANAYLNSFHVSFEKD